MPLPAALRIDEVWGGTNVGFSAVETASSIYVGYYDNDRWLSVSEIDKCTGRLSKVRLPSQFAGWDAHNYVTLVLDKEGRVHLAGNMHVSQLIYARMSQPGDLQSLQNLRPLVGADEDRTTYPTFFAFPDGGLGFSYRKGQSGDGREIVSRFDGKQWKRWMDQPLFAQEPGGKAVNAYHTGYVKGPDGYFHLAWVWRQDYTVETNYHVNYAKSLDLRHWQNSKGQSLSLPMTPANAEIVDPVPQGSGLFNNIRLGFDADGKPVISYLKFDAKGASQLWHARRDSAGWQIYQSTKWSYHWDPRGGGTIPTEISFAGVVWRDGMLVERVRHPEFGDTTVRYDAQSLALDTPLKSYVWPDSLRIKRDAAPGASVSAQVVSGAPGATAPGYAISWLSLPADTRDRPRTCKPEVADCRYSFDLVLHKLDAR